MSAAHGATGPVVVLVGDHHHAGPALRWAMAWADARDLSIEVVSVVEMTYAEHAPDLVDDLVGERRGDMSGVLGELGRADTPVDVLYGPDPIAAVAERAAEVGASTVVLGAHADEGPAAVGSNQSAHYLVHHVGIPVIVVRPGHEPVDGAPVVVGVDGSEGSAAALRFAAAAAAAAGAELRAVYAEDPGDGSIHLPFTHRRGPGDAERLVAGLGHDAAELVTVEGHPTDVLLEQARQAGAGMLVCGTRGAGGFRGLVLGRVPSQLLSHAECPLAVVPA